MAKELAGAEPVKPGVVNETVQRPITAIDTDLTKDDKRLQAVRGIAFGVLMSVPFWVMIAVVLYLLL